MSAKSGFPVMRTDDLMRLAWSTQSDEIAEWLGRPGSWIIEGVAGVRGLRKWLRANKDGLPFDTVYWHAKSGGCG